jgi:hypothetical protein
MLAKNNNNQFNIDKNILDVEITLQQENYIEKVNTVGTIEYKLYNKFKNMKITEFLKHISNE